MIYIQTGYLCDIDVRCSYTTFRRSDAGITYAEWATVWGDKKAPIWLGAMNSSVVSIRTYRVAAEATLDDFAVSHDPYAIVYIGPCGGLSLETLNLEWGQYHNEPSTEGSTDYNLITKHGVVFDGAGGTSSAISVETIRTGIGGGVITWLQGGGARAMDHGSIAIYGCQSDAYILLNQSGFDPVMSSFYCYDQLGGEALRTFHSSYSDGNDIKSFSGQLMAGIRQSHRIVNGGPSDDVENVSDTYEGTGSALHGCPDEQQDPDLPPYSRDLSWRARTTPRILNGYTVASGVDPIYQGISPALTVGSYIRVLPGAMRLTSGEVVSMKKKTNANTGSMQEQRIRPSTASRYYKVYVGRMGQPYLVMFTFDDTVIHPEGDWIASFATNGSNVIGAITANPRLAFDGTYSPDGTSVEIASNAVPVSGYWKVGDRVRNTTPTSATPLYWVCTTAGTPGTWTAIDNFAAKNITALVVKSTTAGGGGSAGALVESTSPAFAWKETDAAADNGIWDVLANAEQLRFRAINDANSASGTYMLVDRTAQVIDLVQFPARRSDTRGANVASANDLTLGKDGNSFGITGTTNINGIATANWISGSTVKLFLLGAITVKNNTAPSAGFAKFSLQGAADFVATSGAVLTVEYDGTLWQETARRTA